MAVAETLNLPAQPTTGSSFQRPLGGNGWTAPASVYEIGMSLAGDVTGGNSDMIINFDPRYIGIVTYIELRRNVSAGALEMRLSLIARGAALGPQAEAAFNAVPEIDMDSINYCSWNPPPIPSFDSLGARTPNTDGTTGTLFMFLYNFNIRVLEKIPLNIILASLPRGETQYPTTGA